MALKKVAVTLLSTPILCTCSATESRIQRIQSLNPDWDQATVQKLANWQIEIGMTSEMVGKVVHTLEAPPTMKSYEVKK
jgi:hypothetical protein